MNPDKAQIKSFQKKARNRNIGRENAVASEGYKRHVLLCAGPACCAMEEGSAIYKLLNKRLSQLEKQGCFVYRTQVGCLSFCRGGPLLVVYPEGTWYHSITPEKCERIIEEHILGGQIIEEFVLVNNPLVKCGEALRKSVEK